MVIGQKIRAALLVLTLESLLVGPYLTLIVERYSQLSQLLALTLDLEQQTEH